MPRPGIETHISRVAPNSRDLLEDALLTELHGPGLIAKIIDRKMVGADRGDLTIALIPPF